MPGYNPDGVSALLVRSEKGRELINLIDREKFQLDDADADFIISHNGMYSNRRKKDKNYNEFVNNLTLHNLKYAVFHDRGGHVGIILSRVKNYLRRIKNYLRKFKILRLAKKIILRR